MNNTYDFTLNQQDPIFNKSIQDFGCYFFSLIRLSQEIKKRWLVQYPAYDSDDVSELYNNLITSPCSVYTSTESKEGFIMDPNCYINRPDLLLKKLCFRNFKVQIKNKNYKPTEDEFAIALFKNKNHSHFVVYKDGKVIYDPISNNGLGSNTVKNGYLDSFRIFKEA